MADEQAPASATEGETKKKGGKKKLIIIVAGVLVLGGAGYFFFLKPSSGAGAAPCPPTTLPGWVAPSAKALELAKSVTKTSPPGAKGESTAATTKAAAASEEVASAAGTAKECEPPEPPAPGPVVKLDSMTISLADGSYLKVGLALQLPEGGGEPKAWAETNRGLRAQNVAVRVLGSRTSAQLAPGKPRNEAQSELATQVAVAFASEDGTKSEVIDVLFTEFVMQ
ncbi:MAG: flagellar basal body-associated FliL family protein [Acidimicrobiia bacterium]